MNISIIIRCGDDERVFKCIESIDEDVEVVVSISENPVLQEKLSSKGIPYCLVPRGNLSVVSNIGFNQTKNDRVIITDSDTIFEKGCIGRMHDALDDFRVVRATLKFKDSLNVPFSKIVAKARDYVNSLPLVYTPGIAVRKSLIPDIGGFLFNDPVPFAVDADLNHRIKCAGIPVKFLKDAVLYHDAEGVFHDMKAAFRIGKGCMTSAIHLSGYAMFNGQKPADILRELKGVRLYHLPELVRTKGIRILFYQMVWDALFYSGVIRLRMRNLFSGVT